ncbi:MAG: ABC transporter substrate-binding protein [Planctomycetaceae bacterium]
MTDTQVYNNGDQDFTAQLNAIRSTDPQMILSPAITPMSATLRSRRDSSASMCRSAATAGTRHNWRSSAARRSTAASMPTTTPPKTPVHAIQEFITKYKAAYGAVPDGLAALGYDAAMLLFDAMKRAPSLKGDDLAAAIAQTKGFQGVTGNISIDEHRNAVKPAVILEIKDGQPKYLTTISP